MQAERDWLWDFVRPAIEDLLRARRRHLEWIDLRLGAGAAQAQTEAEREAQVLKVCLEEVRRSRPFLIALIGDRYGWVPPRDRADAAAREAGIEGDIAGRSVTDLEIDFGVFHDPDQRPRSVFFLRDKLPYRKMIADIAAPTDPNGYTYIPDWHCKSARALSNSSGPFARRAASYIRSLQANRSVASDHQRSSSHDEAGNSAGVECDFLMPIGN